MQALVVVGFVSLSKAHQSFPFVLKLFPVNCANQKSKLKCQLVSVFVFVYVLYRFLNRMTVDAFQMVSLDADESQKDAITFYVARHFLYQLCFINECVCVCVSLFWLVSSNTLMMVVFGSMGFSAVPCY